MLNYDIQTGDEELEPRGIDYGGVGDLINPFPGLRPFGIDECHLFFGREGQVDELLVKLSENKFVSVMGFSGSGKSSLMYCGLIPILYGGFMTNVGPSWQVAVTRPGSSPIENLAESLLNLDKEYKAASDEEKLINRTALSSILRGGSSALVDYAKKHIDKRQDNLFILVDQFEELFRFRQSDTNPGAIDDASNYVNLLLECIKQVDVPIYLALTMRSEYIGDCALFPGLTQMINNSNYLVPQMGREQKRMAIEGPVAVGGGKISKRLVKRLLNEIGDNQDQLPVLQHALMRTWDYWVDNRENDEPMDIRHYNAVGRISEALSQHANEAFDELNERDKEIAQILFKTITEKGEDNLATRRTATISQIAELASVTDQDVINVVEKFRQPGRSFLMPATNVPLSSESLVEVSHESLMRIWSRLKSWVDEEYESAQMYLRLSEAAAMYQIGRTGLWRPPDLQLALNWQKKQRPSRVWAQRYDEAFERAIVFLDTSRITYEAEQKNQEMLQKRLLRRTKIVAIILGIAAVISILFFVYAITQQIEAENQKNEAELQRDRALEQEKIAEDNAQLANAEKQKAEEYAEQLEATNDELAIALEETRQARNLAQLRLEEAKRQTEIANQERDRANDATDFANQQKDEAQRQFVRADKLFYQQLAQSMSVKSLQVEDNDLKGLLAHQAYLYNQEY
ncbi:MAG: High-affnity carbon uptake protein Hat/HatR, partial [Bacteroidota bacterium]